MFSPSARNQIMRILVSHLFCHSTKPTRLHCEDLERKFILRYPFAKDDLGNGYVSQNNYIILLITFLYFICVVCILLL